MNRELEIIEQAIFEFEESGRASKTALARFIIGKLNESGYQLDNNKESVSVERAKKYARHQHYLGTQGQDLVDFEEWSQQSSTKIDNNLNSEKELLDCIHNLMGHFDTPVARLKMPSEDCEIVRQIGRDVLKKHNIKLK